MLEAVVFDFDGVLVPTPDYYFRHMKDYLLERNLGITDDDIGGLLGLTFDNKLSFLQEKYGLRIDKAHFVKNTYSKTVAEMSDSIVLDPELGRLLAELKENGVSLAIASNSRENIDFFISKLGITGFFGEIVSLTEVPVPKPAPDTYARAVGLLGKNPGNCVAIEDSIAGVLSAKEAGLKCVVIPNRFGLGIDFRVADLVVKSFNGLSYNTLSGLV